jgi:DNA-binding MarR family transcriptional regulator
LLPSYYELREQKVAVHEEEREIFVYGISRLTKLTYSFLGNYIVSVETISSESIASLDNHLGYWLRRVSNRVSGSFARSLEAKETSVPEWVVLRYLSERDEATPGKLSKILMMSRGGISKIIDKLEAKGWIECRTDAEDTRVRPLSLTRSGQRVLPSMAKIADQNDEKFFGCLTSSEKDVFLRLLRKLSDFHRIENVPVE